MHMMSSQKIYVKNRNIQRRLSGNPEEEQLGITYYFIVDKLTFPHILLNNSESTFHYNSNNYWN